MWKRAGWLLIVWALVGCEAPMAPQPTASTLGTPTATAIPSGVGRTAATPLPPTATPTPKPVAQVLRLTLFGEPDTIDPNKAVSADEFGVILKVFSNLLSFDSDRNWIPEMAAAMPQLSADGLTLTFKLKPGLKFSDGQPLTASHFEYGWKRQLDPEVASEYAFMGYALNGGEAYNKADPKAVGTDGLNKLRDAVGVKALDELTLEFKLKERAPYFLSILATWNGMPLRRELVERGGVKWTEPPTYIGNGPYVLKAWEHQFRLVFEANPNYARGKPTIARIEQRIVHDTGAALLAYQNDELDAVELGVGEFNQAQSNPQAKAQLVTAPVGCTSYFAFNTTRKPFDNLKVRRAFAQALDRGAYVKNVMKGFGLAADQFVPPGLRGHYQVLKPLTFDAVAAQRELADAGFGGGKGLPEVRYAYAAGERNQARALWVQAQLKDNLDVDIKLDPVEPKAYINSLKSAATTPQIFLNAWCQDYPDPQDWYSVVFQSASALNLTRWKSEVFDRLTRAADAEPDAQKRDEQYKLAAQLLLDEAPVAFIAHDINPLLVKPYVVGGAHNPLDYYFAQSVILRLKIAPH